MIPSLSLVLSLLNAPIILMRGLTYPRLPSASWCECGGFRIFTDFSILVHSPDPVNTPAPWLVSPISISFFNLSYLSETGVHPPLYHLLVSHIHSSSGLMILPNIHLVACNRCKGRSRGGGGGGANGQSPPPPFEKEGVSFNL